MYITLIVPPSVKMGKRENYSLNMGTRHWRSSALAIKALALKALAIKALAINALLTLPCLLLIVLPSVKIGQRWTTGG